MEVFIKKKDGSVDAQGLYNIETGSLIVLKGSIVSKDIAHSEKFRGAYSIAKRRQAYVVENKLMQEVEFKSPSTASNFVTGRSTNGYSVWKVSSKQSLGDYLKEKGLR